MYRATGPLSYSPSILVLLALTVSMTACKKDQHNQLVGIDVVEPGDDCPNGGLAIMTGTDENDDGVLDAGEVSDTNLVCNGEDGSPGDDGVSALIDTTELPRGDEDCPHGGLAISVGLDNGDGGGTAGDGILQPGEIDDSEFICDGAPGYDIGLLDPPGGPAGVFELRLDGGGSTNGDGGEGGKVSLGQAYNPSYTEYGLPGGHVKVFATGAAEAGFPLPTTAPDLGEFPLEIAASTTIPRATDLDCDGIPDTNLGLNDGDPYFVTCGTYDPYIFLKNGGSWDWATGVHVAPGVTLTLPANQTSVRLDRDLHLEGTLTAEKSGDYPLVFLMLQSFVSEAGSAVTMDGDGGEGGEFFVYATASILNQANITALGDAGKNGGWVLLESSQGRVFNTGDIFVDGGTSTSDANGGDGGEAYLYGAEGGAFNSGDITATGGDGLQYGGDGGTFVMQSDGGDLLNSGAVDVSAGSADAACNTSCTGGNGNYEYIYSGNWPRSVWFSTYDGRIANTGSIAANGGSGAAGSGGYGGWIEFQILNKDYIPVGGIEVSGNLTANGGGGSDGGEGGRVMAHIQAVYPTTAEISFLGYTKFSANGGTSTGGGQGGDGGDLQLWNGCPYDSLFATGGTVNFADFEANGGGGASGHVGGDGGSLDLQACQDNSELHVGGSVAINAGNVVAKGGNGPDDYFAGEGGEVDLSAYEWVENRGNVELAGGYGGEGDVAGGLWAEARNGPAVNTGDVSAPGGGSTDTDDSGYHGGYFQLYGTLVDNTGDISLPGGPSGSSTGYGGEGGFVELLSSRGVTANSGSIVIAPGTGAEGDNGSGMVLIDGFDVTEEFTP